MRMIFTVPALIVILFGTGEFARSAFVPQNASAKALSGLNLWLAQPRSQRQPIANTSFAQKPLNRTDAAAALAALYQDRVEFLREARAAEMQAKMIQLDGLKMPFDWLSFGDTNAIPPGGRSLFISMHGGGGTTKAVNDEQWTNQIRLGKSYRPDEGIYVAPRAPNDAWDMWHQAHIDDFFARLIEDFVVLEHVNPNRVYLMGYSAGGDGVYQLAPRTPDRWAAASMMAGHPNEASPLGLRNVPFAIQVGANDAAYHRNEVAVEWGRKLDALEAADPQGYVHFTELHAGKGHWMDMEDRKAIPWMEKFTRNPLPSKVVWYQDDVTHTHCYWLARPQDEVKAGQEIVGERAGQVITLASTNASTVIVMLNDAMLDLDQPVVIRAGGQTLYSNVVSRTVGCLEQTLDEHGDTNLAFSAAVTVTLASALNSSRRLDSVEQVLQAAETNSVELTKALQAVPIAQRAGLEFLIENMPGPDREALSADFLLTNTALAYEAMAGAPWSNAIPPEIFLNDVLPYAVVNETRDDWRKQLRELCVPLVQGCRSPGEAALALNRKLFKRVNVRYSTERSKADQSPLETLKSGLASCTGLSILLVDACRSVGVPARIAGTPMWMNGRGNHTWVEIWDGGWHFLGAAEPDDAGLDHAWFVSDTAQAQKDQPEHAIYAGSFRPTGIKFPLVWAPDIHWVNAVNVTDRYTKKVEPAPATVRLLIKVLASKERRVKASVTVFDPANPDLKLQGQSSDESADLNNILSLDWPAGKDCEINVEADGRTRRQAVPAPTNREQVVVIRLAD